jgi:hypothetical protein
MGVTLAHSVNSTVSTPKIGMNRRARENELLDDRKEGFYRAIFNTNHETMSSFSADQWPTYALFLY